MAVQNRWREEHPNEPILGFGGVSFVDQDRMILDKISFKVSGGETRILLERNEAGKSLIMTDSPTGGLAPVTSEMIIELVIKQRDVHGSSCLLATERLIDAFTCATHYFDEKTEKLVKLADVHTNANTTFLVIHEKKILFDGPILDVVGSKDPYITSFLE